MTNLTYPNAFFPDLPLEWHMTHCERFAFIEILKDLRPALAIEVGTFLGGSLQVLSRFAQKVISVDIDPAAAQRLAGRFDNVEFLSGDSTVVLPELIAKINESQSELGFVLIDGDHSTEGVKRDIEAVLKVVPRSRVIIIMHDSFNPKVRAGILGADWNSSPYISYLDVDFIPGIYHYRGHTGVPPRSMWGGFGCAVLMPEKRQGPITPLESQKHLYEAIRQVSRHQRPSLWRRVRDRISSPSQ